MTMVHDTTPQVRATAAEDLHYVVQWKVDGSFTVEDGAWAAVPLAALAAQGIAFFPITRKMDDGERLPSEGRVVAQFECPLEALAYVSEFCRVAVDMESKAKAMTYVEMTHLLQIWACKLQVLTIRLSKEEGKAARRLESLIDSLSVAVEAINPSAITTLAEIRQHECKPEVSQVVERSPSPIEEILPIHQFPVSADINVNESGIEEPLLQVPKLEPEEAAVILEDSLPTERIVEHIPDPRSHQATVSASASSVTVSQPESASFQAHLQKQQAQSQSSHAYSQQQQSRAQLNTQQQSRTQQQAHAIQQRYSAQQHQRHRSYMRQQEQQQNYAQQQRSHMQQQQHSQEQQHQAQSSCTTPLQLRLEPAMPPALVFPYPNDNTGSQHVQPHMTDGGTLSLSSALAAPSQPLRTPPLHSSGDPGELSHTMLASGSTSQNPTYSCVVQAQHSNPHPSLSQPQRTFQPAPSSHMRVGIKRPADQAIGSQDEPFSNLERNSWAIDLTTMPNYAKVDKTWTELSPAFPKVSELVEYVRGSQVPVWKFGLRTSAAVVRGRLANRHSSGVMLVEHLHVRSAEHLSASKYMRFVIHSTFPEINFRIYRNENSIFLQTRNYSDASLQLMLTLVAEHYPGTVNDIQPRAVLKNSFRAAFDRRMSQKST